MNKKEIHSKKTARLQEQLHAFFLEKKPVALQYGKGFSNTTRSKSYNKSCHSLDLSSLNQIIEIDPVVRVALVEPRVTMAQLIKATLPYGLTVPIIPEFKGITVGGAIMGSAAESSSHKFGTFNDACSAFEILLGNGELLRASPEENSDLFYGLPGSYGSLGTLMLAEIKLIPIKEFVNIRYHIFSNTEEAIEKLHTLTNETPDFIDGIVFSKNQIVIMEGALKDFKSEKHFSILSNWYYPHVKEIVSSKASFFEESISFEDYVFRYDQGAFWMGAYLFRLPFLLRFINEGIFKFRKTKGFTKKEINKIYPLKAPSPFLRAMTRPWMNSQQLWKLLHKAELWIQERFLIQDFCIPEKNALTFLDALVADPGVLPLWLCPIKGTNTPQFFSPHLAKDKTQIFINVGVYGLPSHAGIIANLTKEFEKKTQEAGGRKVLYARSYYTEEEFWKIYSYEDYAALREKTHADGIWKGLTEKVLSE